MDATEVLLSTNIPPPLQRLYASEVDTAAEMTSIASPAGPSRHRRKHTAENWDDDFEFALPARSRPGHTPSHSTSSKPSAPARHLESASGESRANRQSGEGRPRSGISATSGKAKEVDEDEDWDIGGAWDEGGVTPALTVPVARTSIQMRRGSRGPTPLIIPSNSSSTASRSLGPPRTSPSSTSPLSSPPSRISPPSRVISQPIDQAPPRIPRVASASRFSRSAGEPSSNRDRRISHHGSAFAPAPITPTVALSNESSSSLVSWTDFARSSPYPTPSPVPVPSSSTRSTTRERELRHMKSGDMMPPPPLPSLMRRKSKKGSDGPKTQEVRESQVPFSPSMEQLKEMEGKRGFWKRLSGNPSGLGKGSPTSVQSTQELRRRRSSSVGSRSPTKPRPNLSPSTQPPLPPLPNIRSPSAASSASATSTTSASSSQSKPSALAGILRRSTSSLIRNIPVGETGRHTPPSSYTPPLPPSQIPVRTTSRTSHLSTSSSANFAQTQPEIAGRSKRNSSMSKGYHLPSPSIGSPYQNQKGGYFDVPVDVPPLPHSASLQSVISARTGNRTRRTGGGSVTGTDTESEAGEGDVQITPKRQKKIRPVSTLPTSESRSLGWGGDGWTGFPSAARHPSVSPVSANPNHFPLPPSRTPSHASSRIPSSQSMIIPTQEQLPTLNVVEDAGPDSSRSFSTLRRLSSLSVKHGRRISGGWKFGTGSSTSTSSSNEEKRTRARLETVEGSPIKATRAVKEAEAMSDSPEAQEYTGPRTTERNVRGGSVSAPNSVLNPPPQSARDVNAEWDKLPRGSAPMGPKAASQQVARVGKTDKERRRQSWNDFVIPQNVLEKQREVRRGIEGVKRFAGGVETLKSLLATHADLSTRLLSSADTYDLIAFSELDREFGQWLEMATVLIEVGSTGQASEPESPKRSRRVTLASDEAKLAADMMRRTHSTPHHPPYTASPITSPLSPDIAVPRETRKISLPDPGEINPALLGGPPRASPDLWRASTGRQELSKRQLEVLRTMLRTPVSDSSVPASRNDGLRGMSTISASSTSASIAGEREGLRGLPQVFRPSISRSATTDSHVSDSPSVVHFGSPGPMHQPDTPSSRTGEMFPSPVDSTYIIPSQSFPSPITASTLAYGVPHRGPPVEASKMRRGSKVGLAGLKEFIKGLKSKESKKDLRAPGPYHQPQAIVLPAGLPRPADARDGLTAPLSPTSPTSGPKYPFAWRHRPTPSMTNLHQSSLHPPATPPPPQSRRGSTAPSTEEPSPAHTPTRPTAAGPPVSGKERKRPGLRGIFRAGSGSWGDLGKDGDKRGLANKENIASQGGTVSPYPRVGSGGSTESAPTGLRHSPSAEQFGAGMRSTSGPSRLTLPSATSRGAVEVETHPADDDPMMTLRPQRKSRIMGLGWPEEAAAAREMGSLGSDATFASGTSSGSVDKREEAGTERGEGEEEAIALTPESLPVLLEYLRQCEGKLGEWRERVRVLEGR